MGDAIPTMDDVLACAGATTGELPIPGQVWARKDGRKATVLAITENRFGPVTVKEDTGKVTHRTRDGRYSIMGHRGACDEDLMQRITDGGSNG